MNHDRPFSPEPDSAIAASRRRIVGRPIAATARAASSPPAQSPIPALTLTLDQLVLSGVSRQQAAQLSEGIQQELTRLFTEQGISPTLNQAYQRQQLRPLTIQLRSGQRPAAIAAQIARAIYGELVNSPTSSIQSRGKAP